MVIVADRDLVRGPAVARRAGGRFVPLDVGDPAGWETVVEELRTVGRLDVAHLNAGVTADIRRIEDFTDEQYERITRVNTDGVAFGMRAVVPLLRDSGGGAIVVTASLAGLMGFAHDPLYTMTKHAVVGLVRAVAPSLERQGITVNAICPGITDTPMSAPARNRLAEAGFPMIDPDVLAGYVVECATGTATGRALVCQAGRDPVDYHFRGIPGPRAEGAEGIRPPGSLGAGR